MNREQQIGAGALVLLLAGGGAWWMSSRSAMVDEVGSTVDGAGIEAPADASDPPNILIVLWDTVRADRLTVYDPELVTTPRLAKWAASGVVFEQAISPGMWTVPSHASLFTGVPPSTHGAGLKHQWLDNHHITMAEWFGQQGYDTFAFSANPNLSPNRLNLLQGFEHVELSWGPRWRKKASKFARTKLIKSDASTEISPAWDGPKPDEKLPFTYNAGPVTQRSFMAWLDKRPDDGKPWLAYLSYMEAHKPRIPSIEARKIVADEERISLGLATNLSFDQQLGYSYGERSYSPEELDAIRGVYDATLVDLDKATGDLFDELEAKGILDNTIVVFTSDHGEMLGEHQLFGHRQAVYNALVRVPLIIHWPKGLQPKRVGEPVSNLDVFDTLVALTDVPAPDGVRSGGNLMKGESGTWGVFTEAIDLDLPGFRRVKKIFPGATDRWNRTFRAVFDDQWKLITDSLGAHELYHLGEDPNEDDNRAARDAETLARLKARIAELEDSVPLYDSSKRSQDDEAVEDSEAMKEQLKLLGYVDEDE
jgi:arylsulfatase A-like enzyme